jgi:Putative enzyme of poly-gamma-glutamate biosynthesis (capsule formation)
MSPADGSANSSLVRSITLFLCGDVMTGRGIDQVLPHPNPPALHETYVKSATDYVALAESANGPIPAPVNFDYVWGDCSEELQRVQPDARIINLETSVTTSEAYDPKGINYRMHPANTPCLTAAKIDCAVLANNHVLDWGPPGLLETLRTLLGAGIKTAGAGENVGEAMKPAVIEVAGGIRVLIFAAATIDSGVPLSWAATATRPGVALLPNLSAQTADAIADHIHAFRHPGDIVIFSVHWGGNWGYEIPAVHQTFARRLIDRSAADVIHGHSSHHPKAIEVYNGKPILYGCGDFLNDYEGIQGYEEFRPHLVLAYLPSMMPAGALFQFRMTAFEAKRFQLRRASASDCRWLADLLTREGKPFGTRAELDTDNRLTLQWR